MNIKKYVKKYVKEYPESIKDQNKIEDWEVDYDKSFPEEMFYYREYKESVKNYIRKTRQDAVEEYKRLNV